MSGFDESLINLARMSAERSLAIEQLGLEVLRQSLAGELALAFAAAAETILRSRGNVIVTGMGKSGHVGRKISATLASTGTPSHFVHPAEASHGDLGMVREGDVVIGLSWSGETPELSDIIAHSRRFSIPLIAITSNSTSALGSAADITLCLPVSQEACPNGLAPTTSTTMQMVCGDALAVFLLERRGFTASDFQTYHPGGKLGARLTTVGKLMHTGQELPTVPHTAYLVDAIMEMTSKRFGVAGVVNGEMELVGIITDGDLRRAFKEGFNDRPVSAVMTRTPLTASPSMLAAQALAEMYASSITSIFVIEKGKLTGLVNIHDLLRAGVI